MRECQTGGLAWRVFDDCSDSFLATTTISAMAGEERADCANNNSKHTTYIHAYTRITRSRPRGREPEGVVSFIGILRPFFACTRRLHNTRWTEGQTRQRRLERSG